MKHKVHALVYNPENLFEEKLLGVFTSSGSPEVYEKRSDGSFGMNKILYCSTENHTMFVCVHINNKEEVSVSVRMPDSEDVKSKFYRLRSQWLWNDEDGKYWIATQKFGYYLNHLVTCACAA